MAADYARNAVPTSPVALIGIAPCRLADTQVSQSYPGPFGPPSLGALTPGVFPVAGYCGFPNTAQVVVINVTVTKTAGPGWISLRPGGEPVRALPTSRLSHVAGQAVANTSPQCRQASKDGD